ncbi:MAG: hypothetical protein ACOY0T_11755 [Myxococcota bacterium]
MPPQLASALVEIHRRLSLAAPAPTFRHLAFGSGFLIQAREGEVRLVDSNDGAVIQALPLPNPRAVIGLPGGSVLVCAPGTSFRFDPGQREPHRTQRLSLLPGYQLEPSRESQAHVWVVEPAFQRAQRYALDPTSNSNETVTRELPEYDGRAITTLLDGAFLYTSLRGLVRVLTGRPSLYTLPSDVARVWRLVPADRIDRVWLVTVTGEALLLELTGRTARIARRFQSDGGPFDVAALGDTLALLRIVERPPEPRTFVLNLYSATGKQTKSYILETVPDSDAPDWAARALRDHELAITRNPPRIAIGGPSSLRLFVLNPWNEIVVH